jgi:DMSO/TMAO reductase YedYZ molybdopterin-dependent catalytic subunit
MNENTKKPGNPNMKYAWKILLVLLCVGLLVGSVNAATTSVEISRIAADGTTVLVNETVTYAWMKDNLPITGDGATHYGHQGPIFEAAQGYYGDPWDPQEIINTDDSGALRGTSVLDLAALVGGIPEGSTIKIIARDGLSRTFSSDYILSPTPEMGPLVLVWEVDGVNVSAAGTSGDASDGMRIYFFADDGIFGNYDMLQTMPENERYNYSTSYPSTRGLSVQYVDRIQIYTDETEYTKTPTPTLGAEPTTGSNDTTYLYDGIITIKNTGTFTETVNGVSYEIPWYSPAGVLKSLDFNAEYLVRQNGNLYFDSFTDLQTGTVYKDDYINIYNAADLTTTLPADVEILPGDVIYIQFGGDKYKIEGSTAVIRAEVYSPTGKTATWPLFLNGAVDIPLDKDYFEADASTHARVTYTDGNGDVWNGVPLRILVGMADDIEANGASHYTFNSTRSAAGYTIKLTNGDGTISVVNANVLPATRNSDMTFTDDYLIADTLNGVKTALTFVGSSVPAKLTDVRSIDMDVSAFEPAADSWSIDLFGNINGTLADTFLYEAVDMGCAPTHNITYTDTNGDVYFGMGMSTFLGWVDDEYPHALGSETLSGGVTLKFANDAGDSTTVDSDLFKDDTTKAIIAVYKNGEKIAPTFIGEIVGTADRISGVSTIKFTNYRNPAEIESITIIKKTSDGTIIDQTYISWQEMRETFPIIGDGTFNYSIQGPVMPDYVAEYGNWDENEEFPACGTADDPRFKVNDQVKGTAIRYLTDLVGGMNEGDQLKLTASDGKSETFVDAYRYIYDPDPRMGTMFLAWSDDGIDGPSGYDILFRLFMTSDDNIFSLWDMHESMAEEDWGFYAGLYPTPADFSVYKINTLEIIVSDEGSNNDISGTGNTEQWADIGILYKNFIEFLFSFGHTSEIQVNNDRWSLPTNDVTDGDNTSPEGNVVTIKDGDVIVPAADISGSDVDVSVPGSSLIGVLSGIEGVGFYKGGNQGAYFNLDSYEGHTHKKPTSSDKWYIYLDGVEVTEPNWTNVIVYDNQVLRLFFDEASTGNSYEYLFTTQGGGTAGWSVKLINGETETILSQDAFETLAKKYTADSCTDEDGVWNGVPLYVLAGIVDDDDAASFNEKLAAIGYSIRVTDSQADSYSTNFDSAVISNDNSIIVANTLNKDPIPELTTGGKPCAPLQMKGVSAGQLIGNIGTIELIDVPEEGNLLFLSGKMERYITQEQYDGSEHHFVTYGDYEGMPLYTLVSTVDDVEEGIPGTYTSSHFTLNTSIISTSPYTILITSTDGQTREIASSEIASGKTGALNYIIAQKDDGSLILTGNSVPTIFENVRSIELKGDAYQGEDWYILLKGPEFGVYLSKTEIEEAVACDWHYKTFTDPYTGEVWSGMTLASLVGYVDDSTMPTDSNHGGSFNLQLAQNGYTIILTAADGYSAEVDSKDMANNKNGYIIANKVDGEDLFKSDNLKENKYPLRLVGSGTYLDTGDANTSKFTSIAVGGLVKIELKEFAPETPSPTLTIEKYDTEGNIVSSEEVLWSTIWADPTTYPVIGDGVTTYSFQGLVYEEDGEKIGQGLGWDLDEKYLTDNYKVSNVVKGTAVRDLTDLVGGMNTTDEIKFICSLDGWTTTLNYSNIYTPTVRQGTAFLAWYGDGKTIPEYSQGPRLFFTSDDNVFSHADMYYSLDESYWHYNSGRASAGGISAQMVDIIKIIPKAESWTIDLNGAVSETIDKGYFEAGLTCTFANGTVSDHQAYYTDNQGRVWAGMPLWILTGFVDDENSHSGSSYNRTLAIEGYDITVVSDDGSEVIIDSRDAYMNSNYIVANTLDGSILGEEDGWPLRLVGADVTGDMQIKGIQSINLDIQPISAKGLDYNDNVVLTDETRSVDVSGTSYEVPGNTVLGVILESGLKPIIGTKKWDIAGILLFDGLTGYERSDTAKWVITVNSETTIDGYNDETKSTAVNVYEVKVGDVISGKFIGNDGVTVNEEFVITVT